MEAMAASMKTVAAVETCDKDVYLRSHITVWVRSVTRIIIPAIIYGIGYTTCQQKGNRYKQKFFHRAPPSKPFCFPLSSLYYYTLVTVSGGTETQWEFRAHP
jgi:hypothetical protein